MTRFITCTFVCLAACQLAGLPSPQRRSNDFPPTNDAAKPNAFDASGVLPSGTNSFFVDNPSPCTRNTGACTPCSIRFELAKENGMRNDPSIRQGDTVKIYVSSPVTGEGWESLGITLSNESVPGGDDWFVNRGGFDKLTYPNQQHFLQDSGMYGEPIWDDGDPKHQPVGTLTGCGSFTWRRGYATNGMRCKVERTYFVPCK